MHFETVLRKVLGIILIALVPVAVMIPGIPGDVLLITGICLLSDKMSSIVTAFIKKNKVTIGITSTVTAIFMWGLLAWKLMF